MSIEGQESEKILEESKIAHMDFLPAPKAPSDSLTAAPLPKTNTTIPEPQRISPMSPIPAPLSTIAPLAPPISDPQTPSKGGGLEWLDGPAEIDNSPTDTPSDTQNHVFSTSYDANSPSEDRHACLTGLELRSLGEAAPGGDPGDGVLFRCSLFTVLDGHGGCNVAAFASKNLLPTIVEDLASALGATSYDGEMKINGVSVADWRAQHAASLAATLTSPTKIRPGRHAINYTNEADDDEEDNVDDEVYFEYSAGSYSQLINSQMTDSPSPSTSSVPQAPEVPLREDPAGLTPLLRKKIRKSISLSFLNIDKRYINSIDATKVQKGCQSGGAWNAGSCALVTLILQKPGCIPFIVTAHVGDCRAVLGTVRPTSAPVSIAIPHLSQADDEFNEEEIFGALSTHTPSTATSTATATTSDQSESSSRKRKRTTPPLHPSSGFKTSPPQGSTSPFVPVSTSSSTTASTPSASPPPSPPNSPTVSWCAVELTRDHNCYNESEVDLVRERCTTDPRSVSNPSRGGIRRVAGSLAVTRALGDAYLKTPKLSFPPYKTHTPYITAKPEIHIRPMRTEEGRNDVLADKVLVMASDGVWEHAANDTVVGWVQEQFQGRNGCEEECPAKHVCEGVLDSISSLRKKSRKLLGSLSKGRARRSNHDDITVMVVDLASLLNDGKRGGRGKEDGVKSTKSVITM